jgi:hypothetical protein
MKDRSLPIKSSAAVALTLAMTCLLVAAKPSPSPSPALPDLNEKVLAFARASLGKLVGDGSCATLAIAALKQAGATYYPAVEPDGALTWGQPVESFKEALPGDILQFHKAVFQGKKTISKRRWISWHQEYPHHTAIVASVSEGGSVVSVLQQNVILTPSGKEKEPEKDKEAIGPGSVMETSLRMDSLQKGGWVRIYRPVPAPGRRKESAVPTPEAEESGATTGDDPRP